MGGLLALVRRADKYLLIVSALLISVGLLMIYSTTHADQGLELFTRQIIFAAGGVLLLVFFAVLDYRYLRRLNGYIYAAGVASLAGVLFFGFNIRGSQRWYDLGFFQLQPVEFMKLALIIFLASFFSRKISQMHLKKNVAISLLAAIVPVALTLLQPDLGSAIVLGGIWFGMLLASKVNKKHIAFLLLGLLVVSVFAWFYILEDYQKNRVLTFLDPAADPQGTGYNAVQSITAVGSGGFFGRGFARGVVSQLRFLPERQTDFIFASLAEELGLLGSSFLLVLLFLWFQRMVKIMHDSRENFGMLLALGIFVYLFVQTFVNIGMNIGIMPITGIPLPLISYGGSSMVTSLIAIGILLSISIRTQPVRFD